MRLLALEMQLHSSEDSDMVPQVVALPQLPPHFFVPRLDDKPQNPIMDTLHIMHGRSRALASLEQPFPLLPLELQTLSEDVLKFAQERKDTLESIWQLAASRRHGFMNRVLSWDALRPSFNAAASSSPFLSEQSSDSFASARYHLRPPVQDPDVQLVYVQIPDLFQSLLLTVCGTSSYLHIWNPTLEKFVLRNLQGKKRGQIVIVSKDDVVSASLMKRFLTIGNLMRRLELMTESRETGRRHSSRQPTAVLHAFTHALSSILTYLRETADTIPPDLQAFPGADARLTALWTRYEDMESILRSLATLCGREEHIDPSEYVPLPSMPTVLLSAIYNHLADHLERSSPRIVTAMLAYLLTTVSRGYMQTLCGSVGYHTPTSHTRGSRMRGRMQYDDTERLREGLFEDGNDISHGEEAEHGQDMDSFPNFISREMAEVFSNAQKSLVLLQAADGDHPLLTSNHLHPDIAWLWTEEQLENMEDGLLLCNHSIEKKQQDLDAGNESSSPTSTSDIMRAFKVFDLLPGETDPTVDPSSSPGTAARPLSNARSTSVLREFLTSFPATLPPSTPSLSHLSARVLGPLLTHARALSGALVARFLTPTTHLHLHAHLVLLREYLLLTSHAFKARLQDALFSDAEDVSAPVVGSRTYAASEARENAREQRKSSKNAESRSRSEGASIAEKEKEAKKMETRREKKAKRAIGLSPALIIGDKWPPLGSDLNFLLRTVVVDALEECRGASAEQDDGKMEDESAKAQKRIVQEAEWRLGFAIRDLPVGTGKEKWLNPLAIEALDFLYMHYQPPFPLDVLITPAILSKYHRMFAFNLRLMRVENVVRTLFRLTRKSTAPLFPTLTPSNKLLLHFCFVSRAFIMALSSYVYDVAIGSNIDTFLARLAAAGSNPGFSASASSGAVSYEREQEKERNGAVFEDVFSLAEYHSRVLDDVLSSCLLRSGQKAVGDILRGCMELVLELGVLAGELRDGNLEEYEAAPMLDDLWGKFRAKMITLVKVLKALVEKEADSGGLVLSDIPLHMMQGHRRVSGTTANLHQLLLRLNMSDWWTRRRVAQT